MMSILRPLGWFFSKLWWLLDASRRALLNLLLLALVVGVIVALATRGPKPLEDKTTLVLDLKGRLVEQYSGSARDQAMAQLQGQTPQAQTRLRDVLQVLEAAATDPKISTVLLALDDFGGGGQAGLREVAAALERFKKDSKKPVLAYAGGYDQRSYFLAARADEVYMHPMGMAMMEGFGRYRNYYKDALERVGIEPNVIRVGTYKNFGEPYFANAPSPATLESDAYLYGDLWARYTGAVETARKLDKGAVALGIEELPQRLQAVKGDTAQLALKERLVDGLKTRDEIRAMLIERGARDEKAKSFRQISLAAYQATLKPRTEGAVIGVVVAEGEIVDGEAGPGKVGGDSTAQLIRQARENEDIKALVLRVNSPGGSAVASEIVRRELELTRKAGKPVVVSMGDVAASGGYWISMAADRVIADASTVTGSIGVFGMLPTADKLLDKLSIHTGGHTTTWLAGGGYDPRRPLDPRMRTAVQSAIQHIYDDFTGKAAAARKKPVAEIDAVAQGRVWTGAQALERGLIDQLGSYGDAVKAAAELAKLEGEPRLSYVERERGRIERLLDGLGDVVGERVAGAVRAQLGGLALPTQAAAGELAWLATLGTQGRPFAAVVHCLCTVP
ncbi:signal peptide peptidase SppA [Paucibacter sp. PLA-PC-4]|uniref:signal peptide peptidase SppA n=1 Tax=Paucibacter sp. PLA-PC-4 TaxID=2993655 RepID=UPI00224B72C9|nr:signal peptide peptidase SppA [Paucibacter sp. PLA-PC-4]MCX2864775.1 signal peptide peptidase SppA [Paucibacter sp. PLA-PC-4]